MVKARTPNTNLETRQNSEEELIALREKVAQLEAEKELDIQNRANGPIDNTGTYMHEIEKLRKGANKDGLMEIKVKDIAPKTVSLWHVSGHNVGKRVGPVDANNAEYTFLVFAFFKIRLSLTKPTEEWIESYKKTQEYKDSADAETKRRALKNRTTKVSEIEKLTKAIAQMQGIPLEQVSTGIREQHAVKGLKP